MQANTNGLSPSLRPLLGVGWNRALPAPFGFDSGIFPDGVNDYLTIPRLIGQAVPNQITVEYWTKYPNPINNTSAIVTIRAFGGRRIMVSRADAPLNVLTTIGSSGIGRSYTLPSGTRKDAVAYSMDLPTGACSFFTPNNPVINFTESALTTIVGLTFEAFLFFGAQIGDFVASNGNAAIDEFRVYKNLITDDQFKLNYNSGVGNNPFATESLIVWYKFEQFEMLDFSALQDGSDMRLGIRDLSGNNNHAQQFNMVTTPGPGYVLNPF